VTVLSLVSRVLPRFGIIIAVLAVAALAAAPVMAAGTTVAWDEFDHAADTGWGNAHIGGHWDKHGSGVLELTGYGSGRMWVGRGHAVGAILSAGTQGNVELRTEMYITLPHDVLRSGPLYTYAVARNSASGELRAKVTFNEDCSVSVNGSVVSGGKERAISSPVNTGADWCANTLTLRAQVFGSTSTTIKVKAWNTVKPEPITWQWTGTTSKSMLSDRMRVGLRSYISSSATAGSAYFTFYRFSATKI
jgi:hypothetical protein